MTWRDVASMGGGCKAGKQAAEGDADTVENLVFSFYVERNRA